MIRRIWELLIFWKSSPPSKDTFELYNGREVDVYWVSHPDSEKIGGTTRIKHKIRLNKPILSNMSVMGQNYVVFHELGHKERRRSTWILSRIILLGSVVLATFCCTLSIFALTGNISGPIDYYTKVGVASSIFAFVMLWFEELGAELYALQQLGESRFRKGHDEISNIGGELPFWRRILNALIYPSQERVLQLDKALSSIGWYNFP